MLGVLGVDDDRHLVGSKGPLDLQAVDDLGAGPALGRAEHDHRPARPSSEAVLSSIGLELLDLRDGLVHGGRHELVHLLGVVAFDELRRPAAATEELVQLLGLYAGQNRRVANLVAIQVQDRQHCPVGDRVEELVGVPGGRQGARFGLSVADDAGDDETGIVERRAEGMTERVPEFATFVDRPRRRRGDVAGDPAGKRELGEQPCQPGLVLADVGIDLAVGALQVGVGDQCRTAVTGTGHVEHVEVALFDHPVQVHVDEVLARRRAPVSNHERLHVRQFQWLLQERIFVEIELADGEIVGGTPIGIHSLEQLGREKVRRHGVAFRSIPEVSHRVQSRNLVTGLAVQPPTGDLERKRPSSNSLNRLTSVIAGHQ